MTPTRSHPADIDEYISGFAPAVQARLQSIRLTVQTAVPDAQEVISYRMPAFKLRGMLVYFAAFKNHIGLYPPIKGDVELVAAVARYAGEKGNLRFPFDEPIPLALIARIAAHRARQVLAKTASRTRADDQRLHHNSSTP